MAKNGNRQHVSCGVILIEQCTAMDTVLDVGAYIGVYAIAAALMGMKAIAIEPHPANYARLKANAAINSVRLQMLPIAAGERNRTAKLSHEEGARGVERYGVIGG